MAMSFAEAAAAALQRFYESAKELTDEDQSNAKIADTAAHLASKAGYDPAKWAAYVARHTSGEYADGLFDAFCHATAEAERLVAQFNSSAEAQAATKAFHEFRLATLRLHGICRQEEAFAVAGLTDKSSFDEFRLRRQAVMAKWHPDMKAAYVAGGGEADDFNSLARRISESFACIEAILRP